MKTAFVAVVLLLSGAANADFADSQAKARAYRESGQLAIDQQIREERDRIASIPTGNKRYLDDVTKFAKRYGGFQTKPKLIYDTEQSIIGVEFLTRANFECRADYASLSCVDLQTNIEYRYNPHVPSGWGAGWAVQR